ncbi:hypothetical protein ZOSMA_60G00340 [Zostera marina]|uniref:Gem-associated protein 2 n=1 Tax=Zostera marina TaxID=29655 RepID=A0A0K9NVS9_ZOSMR|nr:hypothetical protein ZOSMA_60G00340 [Zostera marina]
MTGKDGIVRMCDVGGNGGEVEGGSDRFVRFRYGIRELKDLQFSIDVAEQKRWFDEVLEGLGSVVVEDYRNMEKKKNISMKKMETNDWNNSIQAKIAMNKVTGLAERFDDAIPLSETGKNLYIHDSNNMEHESIIHGEACKGDEDIFDNFADIQKVAFNVEGKPDFDSGPPQDGFEYLRRTRYEAEQLPSVKVVKFDKIKCKEQTPYMPNIPDIQKCPENLKPQKQWEENFLSDFLKMRQIFLQIESKKVEIVTTQSEPISKDSPINLKSNLQLLKTIEPMMSLLLASDPLSRAALLKKFIADFKNTATLSRENCLWIYSLCVVVDSPLDSDMSATMRSLLRKCLSILAQKTQHDVEASMLNVLVVIAGKFFRQAETNVETVVELQEDSTSQREIT